MTHRNEQQGPRILVTGASGFLGAHVVADAQARGIAVTAGVRDSSDLGRLNALAPGCKRMTLDLAHGPEPLALTVGGFDAVIHCAAYGVDYRQSDISSALEVNVVGSVKLLRALAGARMVYVGTSYEYGTSTEDIGEDAALRPRGIYGVSKAAAALALLDAAQSAKAALAIVRPFTMYGPLEGTHKFLPMVMRGAMAGEAVSLSPGLQERDYIYVGDVADGCLDLALAGDFPSGETFNLCSGTGVSLRTFAAAAVTATGGSEDVLHWGAKPYRPDDPMRVVGNPGRAAARIGWRAATSLAEGMEITAQWEQRRMTAEQAVKG